LDFCSATQKFFNFASPTPEIKTVADLFKTVADLLAARKSYHLTRRPGLPKAAQ
jgi:hypothetical protein